MFIYVNTMTQKMVQTILVSIMINYYVLKTSCILLDPRQILSTYLYKLWPESSNNKPMRGA